MSGLVNVEDKLSALSTHTVQNKVISNAFMNALKGSIVSNSLTIDDVSPNSTLNIKLTSDTITDFSGITLYKCGGNLFNPDTIVTGNHAGGAGSEIQEDGSIYVYCGPYGDTWISQNFELPEWLAGQTIAISGEWTTTDTNRGGIRIAWVDDIGYTMNDVQDNTGYLSTSGASLTTYIPEKPEGAKALVLILYANTLYPSDATSDTYKYFGVTYTKVQFTIGELQAPYEPYVEPEIYSVNADGTVEGLTSLSPNMTLYTDNDGAIVNCQYYRDIDTYIDNLLINLAMTGGV